MAVETRPSRRPVHQWDVHVAVGNGRADDGTQTDQVGQQDKVVLLQSPLRTPDQPQIVHGGNGGARIKTSRALLEWEVQDPASTSGAENNETGRKGRSPGHWDGNHGRVRGTHVATRAPYAVAVLHQGKIHITAIQHCMQVRPVTRMDEIQTSMAEPSPLDGRGNENLNGQGDAEYDCLEKGNGAEAVQVRVRRRETDRQVDARMQSHAFLKKQEEEEAWTQLKVLHGRDHVEKLWWRKSAANAPGREASSTSLVEETKERVYLDLLDPVITEQLPKEEFSIPRHQNVASSTAVVRDTICSILSDTPVMSEDVLRAHLRSCEQVQAQEAGNLSQVELDELLEGVALRLGRVYVRDREGGEDARIRHIVAKCFRHSRVQGKAAMVDAVVAEMGYEPSPNVYNKVMKELCYIRGSDWVLKDGITS
eukprot:CAMPEP_0183823808 /NCGR_PEP_ID=MMETSP0807_2-20130328/249_1 /TAXON_ID=88271 /ORGANISM="Picocystis salinarum, Strain CCMP1897" /LENGTH=422 /DNA_ID=CAMNT_0026068713 /DNA_START=26 /DNA_END=1294 /DNA_ORIENTATION=+